MSAQGGSAGKGESLGRSTAVMAAGTATSRVLGLVRASVLAGAIGVTATSANAFALANWLPNVIYMLIAGGVLNAVLVPQVVRAYRTAGGQEYVDRLLTLGAVLLLGVTVVATAAAPLIVNLASDVENQGFLVLSTTFALWCIPQVFFYGMYTLLGQVLNARGTFGPYMWAPVVNNIVAIAGLAVFIGLFGRYTVDGPTNSFEWWDPTRVALLGGTATLGVACQALVLLVPLYRSGFRYRARGGWRGAGLGSAGRVAGWTFGALLIGQLGILVVTRIATSAPDNAAAGEVVAGNAAYNYAFLFFMLPHSLVTVSLLTALFTRLSTHAAGQDTAAVRADTSYGLRTIGVFTIFATAVLGVLALPVMRLVFPSVPPAQISVLVPVVVALTAGLVALGAWSLVQRVFYAYEDAKGLFWFQVPMTVVVAGGAWVGSMVLAPRWWTAAAGAAIAASYLLGALVGGAAVRRRLGGLGGGVVRLHVRAALAALVAAGVGWPLSRLFGDLSSAGVVLSFVVCAVVGLVMLGLYVAMLRVLRVTELQDLVAPLLRRLGRSMGTPGAAANDPDQRPGAHGGDSLDVVVGRGTLLAGRYRLHQPAPIDLPEVEAWDARDQILDRPVRALVLRGERVTQALDAARRAALVTDPRLVRVLDVGEHEGVHYVVTEPLQGRDLATLTAHGPLPADQARAIIGEAAVALEVARRRGVHHLALRPSSIHVTPDGSVLVSGLALDGELTGHGLGDARSTTRADTVGLVSLLYLTLTGRWPAPEGTDAGRVPVAPVVMGSPVAPVELVPGVPNDLDTLCAVTLGPHDDGPHSPAELVLELEPWGPIAAQEIFGALDARSGWADQVEAHDSAVADAAAGNAPRADPTPPTDDLPVTTTVQRQSVRSTLAEQTTAGSPRPGTPPPAVPPSYQPRRDDTSTTVSAAASPRPSVSSPTPRSAPARSAVPESFDVLVGRSTEALTTKRFDPTPFVLAFVALVVIVGVFVAFQQLTRPVPPIGGGERVGGPTVTEEPAETDEGTPDAEETPEEEPAVPEEPSGAPPVIASGQQLDPEGDQNEHPEAVDRALDGDPTTFWFTRTYVSPTYGMKSGVGYAVTLAEVATVTSVSLQFTTTGGNVEVRATDPATPNEGEVLAAGPMGPDTVFTFDPVDTQHIVLWFTELPQTADGRNRVELTQVSVS
ncbi:murein biosynthesis integral membrane protein MurJ [Actinotalea sp. K2]|uniref:murein biosynthesis integral membrane protein MurJ n=1 Tax=Actinotalea sp. K2 TaxID=2939438 RepID=UPI0020182F59|nr:murein biosynthesis integral membrane protein MurJ [Actinotalea sp. K2]MCL3860746.1 murein biosynthesis integral membrane protein MurJ [Actinotalea sp. K2]